MGTNTDAILFYGFHGDEGAWDDIYVAWDNIYVAWEDRLAQLSGVVDPGPFSSETEDAHVEYWKRRREIVEKEECEIDTHGSGECPMPFVCVKASKTKANRGYPQEILSLSVDPEWNAALRTFVDKMGIPWQDPKWWLVSNWEF
jgi:hypothetical protein